MTDQVADDRDLSPEAAFALLGDETRITTIRVLGDAGGGPLTFSELRERVGARDSGRFNYHLGKLVGTFLRRVEGGYELTYAGHRIVGAILSGEYTQHASGETFVIDSACYRCGEPLSATYEDERVTIRCPDCDDQRASFGFPPGGFEGRSIEELTRAFDDWVMGVLRMISAGICFNCAGKMTGTLTDESPYLDDDEAVGVEFTCDRCGDNATLSVNSFLLFEPAVVAFHYDHGIDVDEVDTWNVSFHDDGVEVLSDDPWRVRSTLSLDSDSLSILVDEELSVTVESR
ncbi:DUF7351 domain-containing protein [Natronorarus salvus]|uniref:DUF7351 domain-containing protein n=1 Tax=Natronorarus salvus TaxID=3117733 RepID=UPI002F26DE44